MKPGQVAFVYQQQGWQATRVVSVLEGKCEVENRDGIRCVYANRRLARLSSKVVASVTALEAYIDELRCLMAEVELESVWELLGENSDSHYDVGDLADLGVNTVGPVADDAMAWLLSEDNLYFKQNKQGRFVLNSPSSVEERRRKFEAEEAAKKEFESMTEWLRAPTESRTAVAAKTLETLKALVLFDDDSKRCKLARSLIKSAYPKSSEADIWLAWRILREREEWPEDVNLAMLRAGLGAPFSPEIESEAVHQSAQTHNNEHYVDYTHLCTVAIDDQYTTEVDDALAIEMTPDGFWRVYIFITDASQWVPPQSSLNDVACRRGATLYVPEGKVMMLPSSLAEGVASLAEDRDCGALAFIVTVDSAGKVMGFDIEEAIIRVDARCTYDEVERILSGESSDYSESLTTLSAAAEAVRAARLSAGAMILDRQEVSLHVGADGEVHIDAYRTDDKSRYLVSEMMVLACTCAAQWCSERNIPTVYRVQPAPEKKTHIPEGRTLKPSELNQIFKTLRRAEMSTQPKPHAGLGASCYTQITSPLRRYLDLVIHRQIKGYLRKGHAPHPESWLIGVIRAVEPALIANARVERESRRYWLLKAMEGRKGQPVEVEVVREAGRRYAVQLLDNGLQTVWSPTQSVQIGDRLSLKICRVNARKDRLVLE